MTRLDRCYNIADLRTMAKKRLPKGLFEFIDLGTEDGVALAENRAAFERLRLFTKYMVDLTDRDMGTEIFGRRVEWPFAIAPTGVAGLCWNQGELALARAAAESGIPFTLATASLTPMETIAKAGGRLWFQIYMWDEVHLSHEMVARARNLGFEALVVTVDFALGRIREHNERNGFGFPFKPNVRALTDMLAHPSWLFRVLFRSMASQGLPVQANYPLQYQRMVGWRNSPKPRSYAAMTWKDIAKLRELWDGPFIVKSILRPQDARLAVEHGADAIIVSNHGGRAMDSAISTIEALPDIVSAVGGSTTIMLDSGIRRGSDVVKALALGADLVLFGRPALYGLAAGGPEGADKAIEILATEFEKSMASVGCRYVSELSEEVIARVGEQNRLT